MTTLELESRGTVELRRMAREAGHRGAAVASARKEDLIPLLIGETRELTTPTLTPPQGCTSGAVAAQAPTSDNLADVIAAAISGKVQAGMDEDAVKRIVLESALNEDAVVDIVCNGHARIHARVKELALEVVRSESMPRRIEVINPNGNAVDVGVQHKAFEDLLQVAGCRLHAYLPGPAGSGKSYAAIMVAKALELPYYSISVGPMTSKSDLVGYRDANGRYCDTALRKAYEHGGVFLLDEMDAGNPGVMTILNGMLSGTLYDYPDKQVERHADFVVIAAANTYGRGADRMYVGRNPLDAATLDRFVTIEWEYDTDLERTILAGVPIAPDALNRWMKTVDTARAAIATHKVRHVAGYRSKQQGAMLLAAGMPFDRVIEVALRKGLPDTDWNRLKGVA